MQILVQLILIATSHPELPDRLVATCAADPLAADAAAGLLAHDDRVDFATRPTLLALDGEPVEIVIGRTVPDGGEVQGVEIDAVATAGEGAVTLDLDLVYRDETGARLGGDGVLREDVRLVVGGGECASAAFGPLTLVARAIPAPTDEDLEAAQNGWKASIRPADGRNPRARRRAIERLLVDAR